MWHLTPSISLEPAVVASRDDPGYPSNCPWTHFPNILWTNNRNLLQNSCRCNWKFGYANMPCHNFVNTNQLPVGYCFQAPWSINQSRILTRCRMCIYSYWWAILAWRSTLTNERLIFFSNGSDSHISFVKLARGVTVNAFVKNPCKQTRNFTHGFLLASRKQPPTNQKSC